MSGSKTVVYTWEYPDNENDKMSFTEGTGDVKKFLKSIQGKNSRILRVFKKSEAYSIARSLGIPVKLVPCLIVFSKNGLKEEIKAHHLPTHISKVDSEVFTDFFRKLFSILEEFDSKNPKDLEKIIQKQLFTKFKIKKGWSRIDLKAFWQTTVASVSKGVFDSIKEQS